MVIGRDGMEAIVSNFPRRPVAAALCELKPKASFGAARALHLRRVDRISEGGPSEAHAESKGRSRGIACATVRPGSSAKCDSRPAESRPVHGWWKRIAQHALE